MPDGLNRVMVIGTLSTDPEMRYTANGSALTTFRLVTKTRVNEDGRESRQTFNVVAWERLAEFAQSYLTKGRRVYAEGRLMTRSWESQDGQKQYTTELVANQLRFIDRQGVSIDTGEAEFDRDSLPLGVNRVILLGNLGADAEMRYTPSGTALTTFRLAVGRTTVSEGERREETEWFRVVLWDKLAEEFGSLLTKGSRVYLEGRLATRGFDGQDGQRHFVTEVVGDHLVLIEQRQASPYAGDASGDIDPDDLPFDQ
jgi:single-strand DNA-binding protein